LNDSLLTYFGARFDWVRFHERDYTATILGVKGTASAPVVVKRNVHQTKPNLGALYKLTPNVRVYANYSESYFVNQTDNPVDIAGDPSRGIEYKPETAKGWDYGVKGSFLNDRFTYTIGGYYIERFNVSVTDTVELPVGSGSFVNITRRDGDQLDRGVEADINWNVSDALSTGLSYGHVNAIYSNFGSSFPQAVGRRVQNISPTNGSAFLKYNVRQGMLKGLSANVRVSYVERTPTESPTAGDTAPSATGVRSTVSTNQWKLTVPSFTLWDAGVRYQLRSNSQFDQTVALNVNNAFDRQYLKVNKNAGDRRSVYISYTLSFSHLTQH
jgi:outer membrane receptor protein involved in Fe transport